MWCAKSRVHAADDAPMMPNQDAGESRPAQPGRDSSASGSARERTPADACDSAAAGILHGFTVMVRPILVVDDEPDCRAMLTTLLESAGFAVTTAADGQEALVELHRHPACVILLDLMMPRMSGEQFREAQLRDPQLKDIPVVVMSARYDAAETANRIQAFAFTPKPLELEHLLRLVRAHCGEPEAGEPPPRVH
jgi:CheY-like chemotaxis protein